MKLTSPSRPVDPRPGSLAPNRGLVPPLLALVLWSTACTGDVNTATDAGTDQNEGPAEGDGRDGDDRDGHAGGDGDGSFTPGDGDGAGDGSFTPGDGDGDGDPLPGDGSSNPGDGDGDGDGAPNPGDGDGDGDANDPHVRCVARINELRASIGLGPLQRWTDNESCSDDQSKRDLESGQAHGNFGQCSEFGQNTCPGWGSVDDVISGCLMQMWNEGPPPQNPCDGDCFQAHGHYINMTNTGYTRVACGFYTDSSGKTWSNQNFK